MLRILISGSSFGLEVTTLFRANQKSHDQGKCCIGEIDFECRCLPGEICTPVCFLLNCWSYYSVIINSANNHKCSTHKQEKWHKQNGPQTMSHAQSRKWQFVSISPGTKPAFRWLKETQDAPLALEQPLDSSGTRLWWGTLYRVTSNMAVRAGSSFSYSLRKCFAFQNKLL